MKISEFHILSSLLFSHYTYILFLSFYIIFVKTVIVNSCRPYYTFKIMLTKPVFSTYFATTKHENPPFLWLYISFCISCDHYGYKILINFTTRIIKWQIFLTRKLYWFPALTFFSNICILCSMHKCFFCCWKSYNMVYRICLRYTVDSLMHTIIFKIWWSDSYIKSH